MAWLGDPIQVRDVAQCWTPLRLAWPNRAVTARPAVLERVTETMAAEVGIVSLELDPDLGVAIVGEPFGTAPARAPGPVFSRHLRAGGASHDRPMRMPRMTCCAGLSGTGAMGGPDLGRMAGALRSAGLDPADVEALILTHLHIDHAGGAVDAAGKAVFPNAELILQDREFAFWTDDGIRARAPSDADIYLASARKVLAAYPNRLRRVSGEAELWQGLRFLPLPGHTPGHSGVLLQDGSAQLLLWADIIHAAVLQFPHPDWTLSYDVDQPQARETRARLLDRLAADRVPAAGAHLADRGLIVREGAGYRLIPQS